MAVYIEAGSINPIADLIYAQRIADPNELMNLFPGVRLKPGCSIGLDNEPVYHGSLGKAYVMAGDKRIDFYKTPDIFRWAEQESETSYDQFTAEKSGWGYFQLAWFMEEVKLLSLVWHAQYLQTMLVYSAEDFRRICRGDFFPDPEDVKVTYTDWSKRKWTPKPPEDPITIWDVLKKADLRPVVFVNPGKVVVKTHRYSPWKGVYAAWYVMDTAARMIKREAISEYVAPFTCRKYF